MTSRAPTDSLRPIMIRRPRPFPTALILGVTSLGALGPGSSACSDSPLHASEGHTAAALAPVVDAPLESFQGELLRVAYDSVSKMPENPHIKNRSRAQEKVVTTCFELNQPLRALGYIEGIENWRRGTGYADFVHHCATNGLRIDSERYLGMAMDLAREAAQAGEQSWRTDRILARKARAQVVLGDAQGADSIAERLLDSEVGPVLAAKALILGDDEIESALVAIDSLLASGDFDRIRTGLDSLVTLFDRSYAASHAWAGRRDKIESRVHDSLGSVPLDIHLRCMMSMAEVSLEHGERAKALELSRVVDGHLSQAALRADLQVPLRARLAGLRYRGGEHEAAIEDARAAHAFFKQEQGLVIDIDWADVLLPLAECFHTMDQPEVAAELYLDALEAGMHNPNSRPRAEDLSQTCLSMARLGFEPSVALWDRIHEIDAALGRPW